MKDTIVGGLYYPVYQKIEEEVLALTSIIYFDDNQSAVYSLKIAELIIRCSIELESIAKDIYRREAGCEPDNPGTCFRWMENNWAISRKAVSIISNNIHFSTILKPNYCPFNYHLESADDYYSRYNAIKHDRGKNLHMANIYTLIRVLGALYILNIYYSEKSICLGKDKYGNRLDHSFGSNLFNFYVYKAWDNLQSKEEIESDPQMCLYKIICRINYGFVIKYLDRFGLNRSVMFYNAGDDFQRYAIHNLGQTIDENSFTDYMTKLMNRDDFKTSLYRINNIHRINSITPIKSDENYYAELNK